MKKILILKISDQINSKTPFYWRIWNHLGPSIDKKILNQTIEETKSNYNAHYKWYKTNFAKGFGRNIEKLLKLIK